MDPLEFSIHVHLLIRLLSAAPRVRDVVITTEEARCSFTFKLATGRGLVGDGVEDLAERGAETWPLDTPLTEWKRKQRT